MPFYAGSSGCVLLRPGLDGGMIFKLALLTTFVWDLLISLDFELVYTLYATYTTCSKRYRITVSLLP